MTIRTLRCAAGVLAGAVVVLAAGLSCAATLNQNLQRGPERPQFLVSPSARDLASPARPRPALTAEAKRPLPGVKSSHQPATAAEIVGRLLAPGASNPDVPLPHPDLSEEFSVRPETAGPLKGPTPYGRPETGGGVLGLRMPIPVERTGGGGTTTSSPDALRAAAPSEQAMRPR